VCDRDPVRFGRVVSVANTTVEAQARPSRIYRVKPGDTLRGLAGRFYGDPARFRDIVAANAMITNADLIRVGWLLRIPL
jgi:nucleoid-associated protein YgaU